VIFAGLHYRTGGIAVALDIRTMLFAISVGNLLMAVAFLIVNPSSWRPGGGRIWIFANLTLFVAWLLLAMRGLSPPVISLVLGNGLLSIGTALQFEAFAALRGLPPRYVANSLIVVAFVVVYSVMFAEGTSARLNIEVASLYLGCQWALIAVLFVRASIAGKRRVDILIVASFALAAAVGLFRAIDTVFSDNPTRSLLEPNLMQSVSFVSLYVSMIGASFGFIMMAKEKADLELQRQATIDALTGIENRRAFLNHALSELARCKRQDKPFALLMLDIDNFKAINDTCGHIVGDGVLQQLAHVVGATLRSYDVFGRYGGEEFVIFLPEAPAVEAVRIAERIRAACERDVVTVSSTQARYTVSIGLVSIANEHPASFDDLLRRSDEALYAAKALGRNCVVSASMT
jgi:diguanylate cyclase (GGDEF)-like protein